MTRIIASGDHHFDEHSRWDECLRIHAWMADLVASEQPDLFLSGGDIYERASTPNERRAVADWLTQIAETCPIVIAKGNHDRPHDCALLGRLKTRHPVIVEEAAGVHVIGGVAVAVMAWPDRAQLARSHGGASGLELDNAAREALNNVLRGLGAQLEEHEGPRVLLGHFMVDGSVTSLGQPLIGQAFNVGLSELALAGADAVIMGHIHQPQDWEHDGVPIHYTGSPFRTAFGEVEEKSVVGLTWNPDTGCAHVHRIPTPARGMYLTELWYHDDGRETWHGPYDGETMLPVDGAELRLRYYTARDCREAARARANELADMFRSQGAHSVKLEEVVQVETRARAPEIARADTLPEQVQALWRAQNFEPENDRRDELLRKLGEVADAS